MLFDRGESYYEMARFEPAPEWFARAATAFREFDKKWPGIAGEKIRWSHQKRAMSLSKLKRYSEAMAEWQIVIPLVPSSPREWLCSARLSQAVTIARSGAQSEASRIVEEQIAALKDPPADLLYQAVAVFAAASSSTAKNDAKRGEYADRAMDFLEKAVKAGWSDPVRIRRDSDIDSLRDRADFQKLLESKLPLPKLPPREVAPPPREKKT
ncbi:MAG TPA: hypothetical protein VN641_00605 [Urbifossiella sp.]|nr:hypothetical protein [Urbifossiella sp.]